MDHDIRVYPMNIGQDGIYMGYTWDILEIGVPSPDVPDQCPDDFSDSRRARPGHLVSVGPGALP